KGSTKGDRAARPPRHKKTPYTTASGRLPSKAIPSTASTMAPVTIAARPSHRHETPTTIRKSITTTPKRTRAGFGLPPAPRRPPMPRRVVDWGGRDSVERDGSSGQPQPGQAAACVDRLHPHVGQETAAIGCSLLQ